MIPKFRFFDTEENKMHVVDSLYTFKSFGGKDITIATEDAELSEWRSYSDGLLMQSTGLFDKNGKEIFDGDIVKHDPVPNPFISNAYFEIIQARSGEWRMDNYRGGQVLAYGNHEVEVVGNKFEHPHLLGEE